MKKKHIVHNNIFLFLIVLVTLFMGVGYAAVNSIVIDINGSLTAKEQSGIYISDVSYFESVNANTKKSVINSYSQTMLNSTIVLAMTSTNSSITYAVTIYNATNKDYYFKETLYSNDFYDNSDITFELNGLKKGDVIGSGAKKTFYIKFKYVDTLSTVNNNTLNSYLNFKFLPAANLIAANFGSYNNSMWKYRGSVTKVIIQDTITEMDNAITEDVSLEQDGTVMSHLILNDDGSTYTAYLQSDSVINLPANSSSLFYNFMKLENIENINLLKTSNVTNMNSMFMNDVELQSLDVSSFDTSKVTNMSSMFFNGWKLTSLNVKGFNTSKVTDMGNMFDELRLVEELDLSSFDTSKVQSMVFMFYNCANLKKLDLSNFNTSKVTKMSYMFGAVSSVTSLDLSSFDTSNVTNMSFMFSAMKSLEELDVSSFNTSKVTDMGNIFNGCTSIKVLDLSSFDMSGVTNTDNMLAATYNLKTGYARSESDASIINNSVGKPGTQALFVVK